VCVSAAKIDAIAADAASRPRQPRLPIEVRREQVLDAAFALIVEHGYAAATMEAIARQAGLAKTVVYNAYPRRGPLLMALLERETSRALRMLASERPAPGSDPNEVLVAWVGHAARAIADNPSLWRLVLAPTEGTPPAVRSAVEMGRALVLARVRELLAPFLAARPKLARIDLDLMARSMLAICEQGALLLIEQPEQYPVERVVQFARDFLAALAS
jgi:AcrR family transcriptional regulator